MARNKIAAIAALAALLASVSLNLFFLTPWTSWQETDRAELGALLTAKDLHRPRLMQVCSDGCPTFRGGHGHTGLFRTSFRTGAGAPQATTFHLSEMLLPAKSGRRPKTPAAVKYRSQRHAQVLGAKSRVIHCSPASVISVLDAVNGTVEGTLSLYEKGSIHLTLSNIDAYQTGDGLLKLVIVRPSTQFVEVLRFKDKRFSRLWRVDLSKQGFKQYNWSYPRVVLDEKGRPRILLVDERGIFLCLDGDTGKFLASTPMLTASERRAYRILGCAAVYSSSRKTGLLFVSLGPHNTNDESHCLFAFFSLDAAGRVRFNKRTKTATPVLYPPRGKNLVGDLLFAQTGGDLLGFDLLGASVIRLSATGLVDVADLTKGWAVVYKDRLVYVRREAGAIKRETFALPALRPALSSMPKVYRWGLLNGRAWQWPAARCRAKVRDGSLVLLDADSTREFVFREHGATLKATGVNPVVPDRHVQLVPYSLRSTKGTGSGQRLYALALVRDLHEGFLLRARIALVECRLKGARLAARTLWSEDVSGDALKLLLPRAGSKTELDYIGSSFAELSEFGIQGFLVLTLDSVALVAPSGTLLRHVRLPEFSRKNVAGSSAYCGYVPRRSAPGRGFGVIIQTKWEPEFSRVTVFDHEFNIRQSFTVPVTLFAPAVGDFAFDGLATLYCKGLARSHIVSLCQQRVLHTEKITGQCWGGFPMVTNNPKQGFVISADNTLTGFDRKGRLQWTAPYKAGDLFNVFASAAVDARGRTRYFHATRNGRAYCLDWTGQLIAQRDLPGVAALTEATYAADVDGDGVPEGLFIGTQPTRSIVVWAPDKQPDVLAKIPLLAIEEPTSLMFADMDGDRRDEMYVLGRYRLIRLEQTSP